jgi:hypothetical protein
VPKAAAARRARHPGGRVQDCSIKSFCSIASGANGAGPGVPGVGEEPYRTRNRCGGWAGRGCGTRPARRRPVVEDGATQAYQNARAARLARPKAAVARRARHPRERVQDCSTKTFCSMRVEDNGTGPGVTGVGEEPYRTRNRCGGWAGRGCGTRPLDDDRWLKMAPHRRTRTRAPRGSRGRRPRSRGVRATP